MRTANRKTHSSREIDRARQRLHGSLEFDAAGYVDRRTLIKTLRDRAEGPKDFDCLWLATREMVDEGTLRLK